MKTNSQLPATPPAGVERPSDAPPEFQRLVLHAVLSGLTPLIPIPYLDDWTYDRLRKNLAHLLLKQRRLTCSDAAVHLLVLGPEPPPGCLNLGLRLPLILLNRVVLYLLKKLIRQVLIIFSLREAARLMTRTFEEGYLLLFVIDRGGLDADRLADDAYLLQLHGAIARTVRRRQETLPMQRLLLQFFRDSRKPLRQAARSLWQAARQLRIRRKDEVPDGEALAAAETPALKQMAATLGNSLWKMTDYLDDCRQAFNAEWPRTETASEL